jgi:hypothetical protein
VRTAAPLALAPSAEPEPPDAAQIKKQQRGVGGGEPGEGLVAMALLAFADHPGIPTDFGEAEL